MTEAIFAVGIVVFLITVYGTVVAGGVLLTGRQIDDQPELAPETDLTDPATRTRSIIDTEF